MKSFKINQSNYLHFGQNIIFYGIHKIFIRRKRKKINIIINESEKIGTQKYAKYNNLCNQLTSKIMKKKKN